MNTDTIADIGSLPPEGGASLLTKVRIHGFRSIREAAFRPGPVSALVGEPGTGKSNLLAALRSALDPEAPPVHGDVTRDGDEVIQIDIETAAGSSMSLECTPPAASVSKVGALPSTLYLPAQLRAGRVLASNLDPSAQVREASGLITSALRPSVAEDEPPFHPGGSTAAAHGLVAGIEAWHRAGLAGVVLLIEEPELFLPPQTQRYLYRLLRSLASDGNQVFYSTHSPSFLNVARLDELVLINHLPHTGTRLLQPEPLPTDDEFRAHSEFDAARSELFLARAAVLVEGLTERLALPFVFEALGYDPDRERISVIECGGKANIPLFARISKAVGVPFVAVHDRDATATKKPNQAEQQLNRLIAELAGPDNKIELVPDFEGVAGLSGRRSKPGRAWRSFATMQAADVPPPLARVVERTVALARR